MTTEHDKRHRAVSLLDIWPELLAGVPEDERALAGHHLTAPALTGDGPGLGTAMSAYRHGAFGFLITAGAVLKETSLGEAAALEVLSPGDVLAPVYSSDQQVLTRGTSTYAACGTASVAVLEDRFKRVAQRWPSVSTFLHDRLAHQTHRASLHLTMLHQPRAEDRITTLFTDLAERFGRMTTTGVVIEIALTHAMIGQIVGSRRPTVSLALGSLADRGVLRRLDSGAWALAAGTEHAAG